MSLKKMRLKGGLTLTRPAILGVVLIGVLAGAMVYARRGPAVLATTELPAPLVIAATPVEERVTVSQPTPAKKATPPAVAKTTAAAPAAKPSVVRASATPAAAADVAVPAVAETLEVITLTGCLQHDDGTFRLKDAAGEDAPKSRSWKSGFLKKHPASVEVVDSANRLGLPTHVGQRVTVTGVMLNKEMRARAVQRLGVCG